MPNVAIDGHSLVGSTHVFRADLLPWVPEDDGEPGVLLIAPGHHANVLAVFQEWNGVAGLDMLYVRCAETGECTHVTPADLGLPSLD